MAIEHIDIGRIPALEAEDDAVVLRYINGPEAGALAPERVQASARNVHALHADRRIQLLQDALVPASVSSRNVARVVALVEVAQSTVPDSLNHPLSVSRLLEGANASHRRDSPALRSRRSGRSGILTPTDWNANTTGIPHAATDR